MASTALKRVFEKIKDRVVSELTPATRLICEIPKAADNRVRQLVVEGKPHGKGEWNLYIQTLNGDGSRDLQDLLVHPKNTEQIVKTVHSLYLSGGNTDAYYHAQYHSQIRTPLLNLLGRPHVSLAP